MLGVNIPTSHKQVTMTAPAELVRTPSPWFAPPVPAYMREPGTNYMSIITSHGTIVLPNGQLESANYVEDAQQGDAITKGVPVKPKRKMPWSR